MGFEKVKMYHILLISLYNRESIFKKPLTQIQRLEKHFLNLKIIKLKRWNDKKNSINGNANKRLHGAR